MDTVASLSVPEAVALPAPGLPHVPPDGADLASVKRSSPAELPTAPTVRPTPPKPTEVVPLTAEDRRLHITVSKRFIAKLAAATDALANLDSAWPGAGRTVWRPCRSRRV